MNNLKLLGMLFENEHGEAILVRVTEWDFNRLLNPVVNEPDLTGSGIPDQPTPKDIKYQEEIKARELSLDSVLSKHRKKNNE